MICENSDEVTKDCPLAVHKKFVGKPLYPMGEGVQPAHDQIAHRLIVVIRIGKRAPGVADDFTARVRVQAKDSLAHAGAKGSIGFAARIGTAVA